MDTSFQLKQLYYIPERSGELTTGSGNKTDNFEKFLIHLVQNGKGLFGDIMRVIKKK